MKIYREFDTDVDDLESIISIAIPCGYVEFNVNFVTGKVSWTVDRDPVCPRKQKKEEY